MNISTLLNNLNVYFFPVIKGEKLETLACGFKTIYPERWMGEMTMEEFNEFNKQLFEEARKVETNI